MSNIILQTDSYKVTHGVMYPPQTEKVYSYFESRVGSEYPYTVFFGLQGLLQKYFTKPVTVEDIDQAEALFKIHFGDDTIFNRAGWEYIVNEYNGYLPVEIKAVPEGSVIPTSNVLMTVVNTDHNCFWLTNWLETTLSHVWYSSTVATLSRHTKKMIESFLDTTSDNPDAVNFMLHDFGYRGASSEETAAIGGAAHLINFMGTDTLAGMVYAVEHYNANLESLAFSVRASEHSVMTANGVAGEMRILDGILAGAPTGIVSVVADSYDIYNFVHEVCLRKKEIVAREGRVVVRPDSITNNHKTPEELTLWIVGELYHHFGGVVNSKGYKVLDDHVRVLWGDGISPNDIDLILKELLRAGYSAENMVFGMGGGLLQKVNRDTQRFAFKCSAQMRNGTWVDVKKSPLDASKASKAGLLKLVCPQPGQYVTVKQDEDGNDLLEIVFLNGQVLRTQTFDQIRELAK